MNLLAIQGIPPPSGTPTTIKPEVPEACFRDGVPTSCCLDRSGSSKGTTSMSKQPLAGLVASFAQTITHEGAAAFDFSN